ncbi:MAG: glycerate kinase [Actinomycetota bacterium]|nr:glycerate kinase [Actinomycetota bacterium]
MPLLLAAPDKFRGTATAVQVAAAAAAAARRAGFDVHELALADGGEGTLAALHAALGGTMRHIVVAGPLGQRIEARWLLVDDAGPKLPAPLAGEGPLAVIESASAVGRALLPFPTGDDPVRANTAGVGELLLAARDAGARQAVVAVGGTAATDGGAGAWKAVVDPARLAGMRLVVAYDVTTTFCDAAAVFGPQKGASADQVAALSARLEALARTYAAETGVEVATLLGAGAGGGLAGGLAALGAVLVPGFTLVSSLVGLARHAEAAEIVVTGEGTVDRTSFEGKVVGGVLGATAGRPALCVAGAVAPGIDPWLTPVVAARAAPVEVVSLVETVGRKRALHDTVRAVHDVVAAALTEQAPARG